MDPLNKIKIVLAEDHYVMREGLRHILEGAPDFEVVGEADDGKPAIELVRNLHPDVLICDIRMPSVNGIAVAHTIRKISPETKMIALSAYDDDDYVVELMTAGASAYMLKDVGPGELVDCVREVLSGATVLHPGIAAKISRLLADASGHASRERELTPRETEILSLAAEGLRNKVIAEKLDLSRRTVENHFNNILNKLSVSSRTEAINYALKKRIIESP
jgi:DNA-binding NarL/FixJ family response regulator